MAPRKGQRVLVRTASNELLKATVEKNGVDRRRHPTIWVSVLVDPAHGVQPWPAGDVFDDLAAAERRVDQFTLLLADVIPFPTKESAHG